MNWIELTSLDQLEELENYSKENPVLIYKHSTRCGTSRMTLDRLHRNHKPGELENVKKYFLDLISYRDISNAIAHQFDVEHESPQVILIRDGKAVYSASHFEIDYNRIVEKLSAELL
jgi:bacillithiol system protein YtxJ